MRKNERRTFRQKAEKRIEENKLHQPKYIRDPVHDIIKITDKVILDLVDSRPMQRLRRIRQLGTTYLVFPGAEHTRFVHSLGVYHLSRRMLNRLKNGTTINDYDRIVVLAAALLHDVGHGPFSHLFETVQKHVGYKHSLGHELWSTRIINEHDEIVEILDEYSPDLKRDVGDAIIGTYEPRYLSSIVSSQLDVDRFDYMLRDCYMTGANYGRFDLNWVFRNLSLKDVSVPDEDGNANEEKKIALDSKRGLRSLEEFLLGNLYMYEHVYHHKTVLAANAMLLSILRRAIDMLKENRTVSIAIHSPALSKMAQNQSLELDDYLALDDGVIFEWLSHWEQGVEDPVLKGLSKQFLSRELFKIVDITDLNKEQSKNVYRKACDLLKKYKLDPEYYLVSKSSMRASYKPLDTDEIYVSRADGSTCKYSEIIYQEDKRISQVIVSCLKTEKDILALPAKYKKELQAIVDKERGL